MKSNTLEDSTYLNLPRDAGEIEHAYGPNVHILSDPFLLTHLAFLCDEKTTQPTVNHIVQDLYQSLIKAVLNAQFPRTVTSVRTRMAESSTRGVWTGQILDPKVKTVVVNIVRAGTLPSQVCFDYLNKTLDASLVRQDHVIMSREVDRQGCVIGAHLGDSKIGGSIDDAVVLFPDPMGATGASLCEVINHYKKKVSGKARQFIALNLIVTPEYLKKLHDEVPEVVVYALRLDRGGSSPEVLAEKPGLHWKDEKGLTDKQYIIPGAGGLGEVMNNSYC